MNSSLARRLRKLEEKSAKELSRNRDIRIVWRTASRVKGSPLQNDSEAALISSEESDPHALEDDL